MLAVIKQCTILAVDELVDLRLLERMSAWRATPMSFAMNPHDPHRDVDRNQPFQWPTVEIVSCIQNNRGFYLDPDLAGSSGASRIMQTSIGLQGVHR